MTGTPNGSGDTLAHAVVLVVSKRDAHGIICNKARRWKSTLLLACQGTACSAFTCKVVAKHELTTSGSDPKSVRVALQERIRMDLHRIRRDVLQVDPVSQPDVGKDILLTHDRSSVAFVLDGDAFTEQELEEFQLHKESKVCAIIRINADDDYASVALAGMEAEPVTSSVDHANGRRSALSMESADGFRSLQINRSEQSLATIKSFDSLPLLHSKDKRLPRHALRKWLPDVKKSSKLRLRGLEDGSIDLFRNCDRRDLFWSDLLFLDFNMYQRTHTDDPQAYRPLGLYARLVDLLRDLVAESAAFNKYVRLMTRVKIPRNFLKLRAEELMTHYKHIQIASEEREFPNLTVRCVLSDIATAIALANEERTAEEDSEDTPETVAFRSSTSFVRKGDTLHLQQARSSILSSPKTASLGLEKISGRLAPKPKLILQQMLALMPDHPNVSAMDRGLKEAEFKTFCQLDRVSVDHHRVLREFCQIINEASVSSSAAKKMRVMERKYVEDLSHELLAQVLEEQIVTDPETVLRYSPDFDCLLVVVFHCIPAERVVTRQYSPENTASFRPIFRDWPFLDLHRQRSSFDVSRSELECLEGSAQFMYPCDRRAIVVEKRSSDQVWCTVRGEHGQFGLRKGQGSSSFFASFSNDSFMECRPLQIKSKKPDSYGYVAMVNTIESGLTVETQTTGSIIQAFNAKSKQLPTEEENRCILGDASVIRRFHDGSIQILYANGDVADIAHDSKRAKVASFRDGGTVYEKRLGRAEQIPVPQTGPVVDTWVDPAARCAVKQRFDGVKLYNYEDGSVRLVFADGTSILKFQGRICVAKQGMATVVIDVDTEKTAEEHSQGHQVDVSQGACKVRSLTTMPDGTQIEIKYDTRVTAQVNGSIVTSKPDGTVVEIGDDLAVRVQPWDYFPNLENFSTLEIDNQRARTGNSDLGKYVFDLRSASLTIRDFKDNVFTVRNSLSYGSIQAHIELAGRVNSVPPIVDDPWQPRLFVIHRDGSGCEILQDWYASVQRKRLERTYAHEFNRDSMVHIDTSNVSSTAKGDRQKVPREQKRNTKKIKAVSTEMESLKPGSNQAQCKQPASRRHLAVLPLSVQGYRDAANGFGLCSGHRALQAHEQEGAPHTWSYFEEYTEHELLGMEGEAALSRAEGEYMKWLSERCAEAEAFDVQDNRDESQMNIDRTIQELIQAEKVKSTNKAKHSAASVQRRTMATRAKSVML